MGRCRSYGTGRESACQGTCAVFWPPVLTSGRPEAGPGVDQHAIGVIVRPDGSQQVTYHGRPLYLFNNDAYIGGASPVGTQGIYGAGAVTPSGVFNTIPPLPVELPPFRHNQSPGRLDRPGLSHPPWAS